MITVKKSPVCFSSAGFQKVNWVSSRFFFRIRKGTNCTGVKKMLSERGNPLINGGEWHLFNSDRDLWAPDWFSIFDYFIAVFRLKLWESDRSSKLNNIGCVSLSPIVPSWILTSSFFEFNLKIDDSMETERFSPLCGRWFLPRKTNTTIYFKFTCNFLISCDNSDNKSEI